jgi:hypothetical protein
MLADAVVVQQAMAVAEINALGDGVHGELGDWVIGWLGNR